MPTIMISSLLSLALLINLDAPCLAKADGFLSRQMKTPRVKDAMDRRAGEIQAHFLNAGASWPPRDLFVRAFKHERLIEVWAQRRHGSTQTLIWSWPICAKSGVLGPKRMEGDGQIPEGIYRITRFNPRSRFHLSLGLNYPNARDRARAQGEDPGSDIFIHGSCVSIGCLAIEDDPAERLYVAAVMARQAGQRHIPVHLFPCRFGAATCDTHLAQGEGVFDAHRELWGELRGIHQAFERTKRAPKVSVNSHGYTLR